MAGTWDLEVNGQAHAVRAEGSEPMLHVLRDHLGLKGTRYGCGLEQCGACMVLVDGDPVHACTRRLDTAAGRRVTTVEGLDAPGLLAAFLEEQAGQCGYCLSGILVSAKALLDRTANPDRATIAAALAPHLCRCGVHARILRAVAKAATA